MFIFFLFIGFCKLLVYFIGWEHKSFKYCWHISFECTSRTLKPLVYTFYVFCMYYVHSVVVTSVLEVPGNRSLRVCWTTSLDNIVWYLDFLCMLNLMTTFDIKVLSSLWYLSWAFFFFSWILSSFCLLIEKSFYENSYLILIFMSFGPYWANRWKENTKVISRWSWHIILLMRLLKLCMDRYVSVIFPKHVWFIVLGEVEQLCTLKKEKNKVSALSYYVAFLRKNCDKQGNEYMKGTKN